MTNPEINQLMNQLCRAKGIVVCFDGPQIWVSQSSFTTRECLFCNKIFTCSPFSNELAQKQMNEHAELHISKFGAWV
jgi:hypothetical protein